MTAAEKKKAIQILKAIQSDWAFTDPDDELPHYVLVNESRQEHQLLRPEKPLVAQMEDDGLITLCTERGQPRGTEREVMDFFGKKIVVPLVHFFRITDRGHEFLA